MNYRLKFLELYLLEIAKDDKLAARAKKSTVSVIEIFMEDVVSVRENLEKSR